MTIPESFVPESHPRYLSLIIREKLVKGFRNGIVVPEGLIAHGRGEAFDYIIGEISRSFAVEAEKVAVALMLLSEKPVISVNGNAAALVAEKLSELSEVLNAPLEVNVFHWSRERVKKIAEYLKSAGCKNVLYAGDAEIKGIKHFRRIVDRRGIYSADTVLVMLEDGDRCELLRENGKKVIAIDLNPLSRTARMADVTIVNNIIRAIPEMVNIAEELKTWSEKELRDAVNNYDNREVLRKALKSIAEYVTGVQV